jgi:hypothetical protein
MNLIAILWQASLIWDRVLFDIKRIIVVLKGLHTITLAGGFKKSHQQSLMKPTPRHQTDVKVCDIIEYTEAPNCLVKVIYMYREHCYDDQTHVCTYPTENNQAGVRRKEGQRIWTFNLHDIQNVGVNTIHE